MVSVGAQARFEAAQALVLRAGEALRAGRLDAVGVRRKTDHQDLVTVFDQSTEQLLRRGILEAFPQDAVVGEEYPASGAPGRQGAVWYLDPIDGTTNFVNQRRGYAVSAACWQGGAPLFGIVLDVAARELYTAQACLLYTSRHGDVPGAHRAQPRARAPSRLFLLWSER